MKINTNIGLFLFSIFLIILSISTGTLANDLSIKQTQAYDINQSTNAIEQKKRIESPLIIAAATPTPTPIPVKEKTKVFIVHGRNVEARQKVYDVLTNLGYQPVVLYERVNNGDTIIEKLEREIDKCAFGIVIMSPDNIVYSKGGDGNQTVSFNKMAYPRLNVIFEFGYLIGKWGRQNVIYLNVPYAGSQSDYDLPSDLLGYVWINYDDQLNELQNEIKNGNYGNNNNKTNIK